MNTKQAMKRAKKLRALGRQFKECARIHDFRESERMRLGMTREQYTLHRLIEEIMSL